MTISSSAPGKSTMPPQLDKQNFTVTKNGFGSAGSNPGFETLNVNLSIATKAASWSISAASAPRIFPEKALPWRSI